MAHSYEALKQRQLSSGETRGRIMIEGIILLLIAATLVYGGSAIWRFAVAQARHRWELGVRTFCLSIGATVLLAAPVRTLINSRTHQVFGGIVPRVSTPLPVVALTFDDAPFPEPTEQVLAILRELGVTATFFATGQAVERHTETARRIVEEGHELGSHSYSHQRMILKSHIHIEREIELTDQLIRAPATRETSISDPPTARSSCCSPTTSTGRSV